jgi:hypothetical protein
MNSAVSPNPHGIVRHGEYYIHGGDVILRVEGYLFRVHRFFLTRDSAFFRDKLPHPPPPGDFTKGSSDSNPIILEDASRVDFERLLWVFYNPKYSIYEANLEEWTSILKLAHQWEFTEVKALALRELEELEIPALQKIIIYQTHSIDRNLLQDAYATLTVRDDPITIEEGRELGLETALQLARAREIARAPVFSGKKSSGAPRSPVNLAGVELDALIQNLFQLSSPPSGVPERPSTPQTPTGRGTPTGGRNTPQLGIQTNGTSFGNSRGSGGTPNGVANGHANGTSNGQVNGRNHRK